MIKRIPAVQIATIGGMTVYTFLAPGLETANVEPSGEQTAVNVQRHLEGFLPDSPEKETRPVQTVRGIEMLVSTNNGSNKLSDWTIHRYGGMIWWEPPLKNR